jgi:hypothetical protein
VYCQESPSHVSWPYSPGPGLRVVPADVTRDVLDSSRVVSAIVRVAHDHDPVHHDRWGRRRDIPVRQRPAVRVNRVVAQTQVEVHDPVQPEVGQGSTGVGVERGQVVAGRDRVDDTAAIDLRVGDCLAVVLSRGGLPARIVPHPPHPQRLARGRVDRHHGASLTGDGVELVAHLERRGPVDEIGLGAVVGRFPAPCDLELPDVARVDLIQRRIAAAALVPAPVAPLAVLGARTLRCRGVCPTQQKGGGHREHGSGGPAAAHHPVHGCLH